MAHQQGMILLSLDYVLLERPMQRRFASDPLFKASLLLLQERIPRAAALYSHPTELSTSQACRKARQGAGPGVQQSRHADPRGCSCCPMANDIRVMVTNSGGGSSRWKDLAVTRWREDATSDNWGTFCYIRDVASGDFWSTAHQPGSSGAAHCRAIFTEARARSSPFPR